MREITPIHCPHCGPGNSMVEAYQDDHGYWKVGCGACGSHSGTLHPNHKPDAKRLVIESWNRRPEEDRLRQLLSEAEKREREAKRIAVNAETYGYGHGLEAAAVLMDKIADKQKQAWDEHVASGSGNAATSHETIYRSLASQLRSMQSENHQMEARKNALEEAAQVADQYVWDDHALAQATSLGKAVHHQSLEIAKAIRALALQSEER